MGTPKYPHPNAVGREWTDADTTAFILWLAEQRGYNGYTFATFDERHTPGYGDAYLAGAARRHQEEA
jgi:hypothetical protein